MGVMATNRIASWRDPSFSDPDAARPIGTRSLWPRSHTATLVEWSGDRVAYWAELPVAVFASEVRSLPPDVVRELGLARMHAWLFTAARPSRTDPGIDLNGYDVWFSALLYSRQVAPRVRQPPGTRTHLSTRNNRLAHIPPHPCQPRPVLPGDCFLAAAG